MNRRFGCSSRGYAPNLFPRYNCGQSGHFTRNCPMPPKQGQQSGQQSQKQNVAHFKPGQVHYTTLEGIPEGAPVMAGTFSVNDHPVTVLFDSGASHTFISKECTIRLGLKIENMPNSYNIHSPRGPINYQPNCQASASPVTRKRIYSTSYSTHNSKSGYYTWYELDEGTRSSFGH